MEIEEKEKCYIVENHNTRGTYNLYRYLLCQICADESKMIYSSASLCEDVNNDKWEVSTLPKQKRGGIITFPADVNSVQISPNKLKNWIEQKFITLETGFSCNKKTQHCEKI